MTNDEKLASPDRKASARREYTCTQYKQVGLWSYSPIVLPSTGKLHLPLA